MGNEKKLAKLKEENARLLNLNQKLNKKLESLENRDDAEFINNISHEMRIPAQAINAISKGLVQNWKNFDNDTNFDLAKKIASNAERLYSLIDNLIEIPNIKKGHVELKFSQVAILEIIKDLIDECKNFYISGKNIEFKTITNIKPESKFLLDPNKITQVLRNILTNAIKASASGKIIIDSRINQNLLEIAVTDEGTGIPETKLPRLFTEDIGSGKSKEDNPGAGIGLSIASAIIKAHKGKITARNNIGKGARVVISLPVTSANVQKTANTSNKTKDINVVIIDDEETCLLSMSMMLMQTSYQLSLFSSPKEALEQLRSYPQDADIILLDIMMPELDGISLLKELKTNKKLKAIPVIMQSGVADMSQIDTSLSLGAVDFIRKPFTKGVLIAAIENVFKKKD